MEVFQQEKWRFAFEAPNPLWCLKWWFVDGMDVSAKCYLPTGPPDCFIDPTNDEHLDVREPRIVSGDVTRNGDLGQRGFLRCPLPGLMRVASVSPIPQAPHIFGELYNDNGYCIFLLDPQKLIVPIILSQLISYWICVPSDTSVHNHVHKVMSCHVFFSQLRSDNSCDLCRPSKAQVDFWRRSIQNSYSQFRFPPVSRYTLW
jgi:hypothetical protein